MIIFYYVKAKTLAGVSKGEVSNLLAEFNNSLSFDFRLWREDITGSLAHAAMLSKQNIISKDDHKAIKQGLEQIQADIEADPTAWLEKNKDAEDIHMAIEEELTALIGDAGKKLHTARSRNDQVATDIKLYLIQFSEKSEALLKVLATAYINRAEEDINIIIPGYTHLQQAQPVSMGHYWLAHYERISRDISRLDDYQIRLAESCPLGSGALAGTSYDLDREYTAKSLGFKSPSNNSLDSVSDRDHVAEIQFIISLIGIHLSQLSEELIIWASQEYGFIGLDDNYATGSSMMPQKRNPDIPELVRGKSARLISNLNNILITLKALPLAYNKDLQEDKEALFDSCDQIEIILKILIEFIPTLIIKENNIKTHLSKGFMNATDFADYLVGKGLAFRDAYRVTGEIVRHCLDKEIQLSDLSLDEFQEFSKLIGDDIYSAIDLKNCATKRNSYGGGSPEQVKLQIKKARKSLK